MDPLLKKILEAPGISGYESAIAKIMHDELRRACRNAHIDSFGNVIATKGSGKKKIMVCAHMDEIGLLVKQITKDGYLLFIKVGGIDDRILPAQRVVVKARGGDLLGIIGSKPPHMQKDEERKLSPKYEDMYIDIGCKTKEEAHKKVEIGDAAIFEPNAGVLNGKLYYGKAVDDRVGCYALIRIMEKVKASAQVFAVATTQEEVGLKGARTSSFRIEPDFALAIDTTISGDTPHMKERDSALKLGGGISITIMEAAGRGVIVSEKIKNMLIDTAKKNRIKYQIDVIEGGMTDGAMIYMNRGGIPTGVLAVPTRYIHSASAVFNIDDVSAAIELAIKAIERVAKEK